MKVETANYVNQYNNNTAVLVGRAGNVHSCSR